MAQLCQDYDQFKKLESEIVVIAPDTMQNANRYFANNPVPFPALVDDTLEVYQQFDVQSKLISLGQRPGLFIIDKNGIVQFAFVGMQQWEIPNNSLVLQTLAEIKHLSESSTQSSPPS
ncbi:MAG TPA: hypothetical protein DCY42_01035 [Chloroflexi bacterium]|nr:hypothetical protein [Chloroflexota bacterium]